jgi:phage/plasmid-like protein (TIGR03299 family)
MMVRTSTTSGDQVSHEINIRKNGMAEMGYVTGTARWHGLGNELKKGAGIDDWKVKSGMDWSVQRSKVRYAVERDISAAGGTLLQAKGLMEYPEQHVLFRSDTKAPLAIVSDGFKVVQPGEALEFFRDLCEHNGFKMRTAGVLFGGKRYWALADIGEESFVLDPTDRVKGRLLFVTACDGSMKSIAKYVAECVVCSNTQKIALAEDGKQVGVSHRSVFNATDVKAKLGLASGEWNAFITQARALARRQIHTVAEVEAFMVNLLGSPEDLKSEEKINEVLAGRAAKAILAKYAGAGKGSNLKGRSGTTWGLVNAVTEYVDHDAPARSTDNRFNASQFGAGDELKTKAMELAVAMV